MPKGWKDRDDVDSSGGGRWRRYGSADEEVRLFVSGGRARRGVHADEGNDSEEGGIGQGEHGSTWIPPLRTVKFPTWLERAVHPLGAIPVFGRSARLTGDVPEGCEMRDERVEAEK